MEKKTKIIKDLQQEVSHPRSYPRLVHMWRRKLLPQNRSSVLGLPGGINKKKASSSSDSIPFNDFLCSPNASWQFPQGESWPLSTASGLTLAETCLLCRGLYGVNTGVCFWSWLQRLVRVDKLVYFRRFFCAGILSAWLLNVALRRLDLNDFSVSLMLRGLAPEPDI